MSSPFKISLDVDRLVRLVLNDLKTRTDLGEDSDSAVQKMENVSLGEISLNPEGAKSLNSASTFLGQTSSQNVPKTDRLSKTESSSKLKSSSTPSASLTETSCDDESTARLTEKVVSLNLIHTHFGDLSSGKIKRLVLLAGAILTPSAKDELRKYHVKIEFGPRYFQTSPDKAEGKKVNSLSLRLPGERSLRTESHSSVPAGLLGNAADTQNLADTRIVSISQNQQNLASAQSQQKVTKTFFLANHLPEPEDLPKAIWDWLNAHTQLTSFRQSCIVKTTRQIAEAFQQNPEIRGVVLTHYPSLAAMLLNRHHDIRAMLAISLGQVIQESSALTANMLVIDPAMTNPYQLRQMIQNFVP